MKKEWYALATMLGMIVGAGILGIPYAFMKAGLLYGILNLLVVGFFVTIVNLWIGEIVLRTNGRHQLTGYAEKYLGKFGKELMAFAMVIGIYGAMIAYLIGSGETLASLFGGNPFFYTVAFFIIFSTLIFAGIKTLSRTEFFFMIAKGIFFLAIIVLILAFIKPGNLVMNSFSISSSLFPFGIVLFALLGMSSIPEVRELVSHDPKKLKKIIILGSIIPIAIYLIFGIVFLLVFGNNIAEVATISLAKISEVSFIFGAAFALVGMTTAYLALGLALQEMYNYDYKLSKKISFMLTCGIPIILVLIGVKSFIKTIGLAGALSGGLTAILVTFMFYRAKNVGERKPEYEIKKNIVLTALIIIVFILGMAIELWNLL